MALHTFRLGLILTTVLAAAALVAMAGPAQEAVDRDTIDGRPVITLSNDKLSLSLRAVGGAMVRLLMKDDPGRLNPFEGLCHFVWLADFKEFTWPMAPTVAGALIDMRIAPTVQVDDVRLETGAITIEDRKHDKQIVLKISRGL